jgi:hypothetical protein
MSDSSSPSQQLPNSEDVGKCPESASNEERPSLLFEKLFSDLTLEERRSLVRWALEKDRDSAVVQPTSNGHAVYVTNSHSDIDSVIEQETQPKVDVISIRARPAGPNTDEVSALSQSLSQLGVGTDEAQKQ